MTARGSWAMLTCSATSFLASPGRGAPLGIGRHRPGPAQPDEVMRSPRDVARSQSTAHSKPAWTTVLSRLMTRRRLRMVVARRSSSQCTFRCYGAMTRSARRSVTAADPPPRAAARHAGGAGGEARDLLGSREARPDARRPGASASPGPNPMRTSIWSVTGLRFPSLAVPTRTVRWRRSGTGESSVSTRSVQHGLTPSVQQDHRAT